VTPGNEPSPVAQREPPTLELIDVAARYEGRAVLQPTSLTLHAGQTLALIGASGSGKTTLLRAVLGLLPGAEGHVRFVGELLGAQNVLSLRARMGYVVQGGGLFPHLTARDNVTLMARHLQRPPAFVERRLSELCALCRLPAELLERHPAQLSGGQRQRVALMRALMLEPRLLLLDEPLGAIDPLVRAELQEDLVAVFAQLRQAVLLVTHDLAEAAFLGHELAFMHEGRIVQRGPFEALVRAPAEPIVTRFVRASRSVPTATAETTDTA